MSYLLMKIWMSLLLTAFASGVAGWILSRRGKKNVKRLEQKWRSLLTKTENERDHYTNKMKNLDAMATETKKIRENLILEKESMKAEIEVLEKEISSKSIDSSAEHTELVLENQSLEEQITALNSMVEKEQQIYSQRIAELEAGEEYTKRKFAVYDDKVNDLQSQLDQSHISLSEATNKLVETESQLETAEYNLTSHSASADAKIAISETEIAAIDITTDNRLGRGLSGEDYPIGVIESLSANDTKQLKKLGVVKTTDLLDKASSREKIASLAKRLGKEGWVVRSWASVADLLRIRGVDAANAELLELAGVATGQNLERSKLDKLVESISVIHRHVGKTPHVPSREEISAWIDNAMKLEPMLEANVDRV